MIDELVKISDFCDGVRCDMAMLVEPDEFEHTWGIRPEPFWEKAVKTVKQKFPEFLFIAEVYWNKEWELQQKGLDYTYDKRLYDRLAQRNGRSVREHLFADINYQRKMVRFMENHDEKRAAQAFEKPIHFAAAVVTYLSPGLRFFHQGQFEGKKVRIPAHLSRGREEKMDNEIHNFYDKLLKTINRSAFKNGTWQLLDCSSAGGNNSSWDNFIGWCWKDNRGNLFLVFVNYSREQSQCFVQLPFTQLANHVVKLVDLFGSDIYERDGDELINIGLFLDMQAWGIHVFKVIQID
jgi:hypothetical protein